MKRRWKRCRFLRASCTTNELVKLRVTRQRYQQVFLTFSVIIHMDHGQFEATAFKDPA